MKSLPRLALGLLLAVPAYALDSDRDQPLNLTADELDLDLKTGKRIYRGNVLFEQGSIRIDCDELITQFDAAGELAEAECIGRPGRFKQRPEDSEDDLIGTAESLQYKQEAEIVILTGEAEVVQGNFSLRGDSITYDLNTERVTASGLLRENLRPSLVVQPRTAPDAQEATDGEAAEEAAAEESAEEAAEEAAIEEAAEEAAEETAGESVAE